MQYVNLQNDFQMWHQNLEGGELAGSSVGPIVGGLIAVCFIIIIIIIIIISWADCRRGDRGLFHHHSDMSSMIMILVSGNRPGGKSSGWHFSLDEEEKVTCHHLHEQGN